MSNSHISSFDITTYPYGEGHMARQLIVLLLVLNLFFALLGLGGGAFGAVPPVLLLTENLPNGDGAPPEEVFTVVGVWMPVPDTNKCLSGDAICCLVSESSDGTMTIETNIAAYCENVIAAIEGDPAFDPVVEPFTPSDEAASWRDR